MLIPKDIVKYAKWFLEQNEEREALNETCDYDTAFEVECNQRDNGTALAEFILSIAEEK